MDAEFSIKVIGIAFALSGWVKVYLDHQANKPKITGRILNVMKGQTNGHEGENVSGFFPYLYLLNSRKNVMHILDYELSIKVSKKWIRLKRVYGMEKHDVMYFQGADENQLVMHNFKDNLIYKKDAPVQHGVPLHGWLVFSGGEELYSAVIEAYKLVCIDAGFKRHVVVTKKTDMFDLKLLQQIAEMTVPDNYKFPPRRE